MATTESKGMCSTGGESDDNRSQNSFSNRRRAQMRASTSTDTPRPEQPVVKDATNIEHVGLVVPIMGGGSTAERRKSSGKMWSEEEFSAYYEAIKIVGKDFDGIVKLMAKKKNVHRDKDQIRNYFFNCVKFVRNCIDVDMEGIFPELCRDAKELFLVINAGEWRKRTGRNKYVKDRMRELLFEGVTSIKSTNKRNLVLKTPSCPALSKYFTETRGIPTDKFCSDVVIYLNPATNSDCAYVVACQQNPTLALRINANDRLSRIFDLLNVKWRLRHAKDSKSIFLRPAKSTEIGQVVVSEAITDTEQVSLNRLKREIDTNKEKTAKRDNTLAHNTVATYSAITPHPFTINEKMLVNGLGANNVGEASVAELYCLCGMKSEFTMVYSIKSSRRRADGWQIFRELVVRDFGDQLTVTREDEIRTSADGRMEGRRSCRTGEPSSERDAYLEHPEAKRIRADSQSNTKNSKSFTSGRITPSRGTPVVQCKVGNTENTDFMAKFEELRTSNKQNAKSRSRTRRKVPSNDIVPAAPMGSGFAPLPSSGRSSMSQSHPTDFSQLVSSRSEQQLLTVKSEQQGGIVMHTQYVGQSTVEGKEMMYLYATVPARGMPSAEEMQQQMAADEALGDSLYSPMKSYMNISNVSLGSSDSMQKMVENRMDEMMCQNSNDVLREMHPLLAHVEGEGEHNWNLSNL